MAQGTRKRMIIQLFTCVKTRVFCDSARIAVSVLMRFLACVHIYLDPSHRDCLGLRSIRHVRMNYRDHDMNESFLSHL